jgi:hypothetical protein
MISNNTSVTESMIYQYFGVLSSYIRHIIIDDDRCIQLIGNVSGNLPKSKLAPLIGWKRYWYSKYRIAQYVYDNSPNKRDVLINFRFDILTNSNPVKSDNILSFITSNKDKQFTRNQFIKECNGGGIDNIYIGTIETQYRLISHFHFHLDSILETSKFGQEMIVFEQNEQLFG